MLKARFKSLAALALVGVLTLGGAVPTFAAGSETDSTDDVAAADGVIEGYNNIKDATNFETPFTSTGSEDDSTKTFFTVKPGDLDPDNGGNGVLGDAVVVSIPAQMELDNFNDATNGKFFKDDVVYARGRTKVKQKLVVKTATKVDYAHADDPTNTKVPGTITFGTASGTDQVTEWTAQELVAGVKGGSTIVSKPINATVDKKDIDFLGSYDTKLLFNIQLVSTATEASD